MTQALRFGSELWLWFCTMVERLHCIHGAKFTLQTAVHVVRMLLRCNDCRRVVLHRFHSVRVVRPQRLFTPHFDFQFLISACLHSCLCLIPNGGSNVLDSRQVVHMVGTMLVSWHPLVFSPIFRQPVPTSSATVAAHVCFGT